MPPRPYTPLDRDLVLDRGLHPKALDQPNARVFVTADAGVQGVSLLYVDVGRNEAELSYVNVEPATDFMAFLRLAQIAAVAAVAHGATVGRFYVHDPVLLRRLERTFRIAPVPDGRNVETGEPARWLVVVDLVDAVAQLAAVLG